MYEAERFVLVMDNLNNSGASPSSMTDFPTRSAAARAAALARYPTAFDPFGHPKTRFRHSA